MKHHVMGYVTRANLNSYTATLDDDAWECIFAALEDDDCRYTDGIEAGFRAFLTIQGIIDPIQRKLVIEGLYRVFHKRFTAYQEGQGIFKEGE